MAFFICFSFVLALVPTRKRTTFKQRTNMLNVEAIYNLANKHGLKFQAHYGNSNCATLEAPKPKSISISFHAECVAAWKALMTELTEVPVSITGTRQVTGSGATDGRLFPCYEAVVNEVNERRAEIGLAPVI